MPPRPAWLFSVFGVTAIATTGLGRVPQMSSDRRTFDYEPVRPGSRASGPRSGEVGEGEPSSSVGAYGRAAGGAGNDGAGGAGDETAHTSSPRSAVTAPGDAPPREGRWRLKRGHALSYAGLFLFTAILYFRPYELSPALMFLSSSAFWIAVVTLLVFLVTQLGLEGSLTARPREVNLVLAFCLLAALSIPFAVSPAEAWELFSSTLVKVIIMFIVMVNVVRTERRLKGLLFLALAVGCVLSATALRDYLTGNLTVEGYRVEVRSGGMFGNPNDLALHLAMMVPIAGSLMLGERGLLKKTLYGLCALLMVVGITVTFSRMGFLGLVTGLVVLAWKFGRRRRLAVVLSLSFLLASFFAVAPGNYAARIISIFDSERDLTGSRAARQQLLTRSVLVALRHPLLGVGMSNFHFHSIREQASHNAYTQVAAEMGLAALVVYVMFIVAPLRRLRQIERETFEARRRTRFYHLSVGLQASLVCYLVSSLFASVAYLWYVYYAVGYAVCLRRMYEAQAGAPTLAGGPEQAAGDGARERRGPSSFHGDPEAVANY